MEEGGYVGGNKNTHYDAHLGSAEMSMARGGSAGRVGGCWWRRWWCCGGVGVCGMCSTLGLQSSILTFRPRAASGLGQTNHPGLGEHHVSFAFARQLLHTWFLAKLNNKKNAKPPPPNFIPPLSSVCFPLTLPPANLPLPQEGERGRYRDRIRGTATKEPAATPP